MNHIIYYTLPLARHIVRSVSVAAIPESIKAKKDELRAMSAHIKYT